MQAGRALAALLALADTALAQDLLTTPPLATHVAALPRLAGNSSVAHKVNAELDKLDARDLAAVDCNADRQTGQPFRSVDVLSDGPDFLSLRISTGAWCERAAHPWALTEIVTFDLRAGKETDLRNLLPGKPKPVEDQNDLLFVLFLNSVDDLPGDCAATYATNMRAGYLTFDLGLDEANRALVLWPHGLAYVDQPCLDLAHVPVDRLTEAGFDRRLTDALSHEK